SVGTVIYAGWNGGYGNFVKIDHGGGITSSYGHIVNGGILVHTGQQVGPGRPIARVGTTGSSSGCHLHFEIRTNGNAVNPVYFLRIPCVKFSFVPRFGAWVAILAPLLLV